MRRRDLQLRSLIYHARMHLAVGLGVVVCTATLTGALLVGDAMRGSLREAALTRLRGITHAVQGAGFFTTALADGIGAPVIQRRASVAHTETGATVHRVNVLGVDERFWPLSRISPGSAALDLTGRDVMLSIPLAQELHARVGDEVLLRLQRPASISPESLLGRRDEQPLTLRLRVAATVPADDVGGLTLEPRQAVARNAFVPLETLQRALEQRDRVNTLLVTGAAESLATDLRNRLTLDDVRLNLRAVTELRYVALEADAFLLAPGLAAAAERAGEHLGWPTTPLLAYLANRIARVDDPSRGVPYSSVVAWAPHRVLSQPDGTPAPPLTPGTIWLNDWTATQLDAALHDRVLLTYYVAGEHGALTTAYAEFIVAGIVALTGAAADPGLVPAYPGVTDAEHLSDWDPPFPIDLKQIRDIDEEYWDDHRATPKAFVHLIDGQRLWTSPAPQLGQLTALRFHPPADLDLAAAAAQLTDALRAQLTLADAGLHVDPVRARALAAAQGTTDFAGLFLGFSFFLIVSAALLVGLMFRLNLERRASEIGLLTALGLPRRLIVRLYLLEGAALAVAGALAGLLLARGYAWLMLAGLRSWWSDAVNAPFLRLHDSALSYAIGWGGGVLVAWLAMLIALRGLLRQPPRALLAGQLPTDRPARGRGRGELLVAALCDATAAATIILSLTTTLVAPTAAFFVAGTAVLVGCLAGLTWWLKTDLAPTGPLDSPAALPLLGVRNARRHPGRSLLITALIAVATFVITSLHTMRLVPPDDLTRHDGPTAGFTLLAESMTPLIPDLNTRAGRDALGLTDDEQAALAATAVVPFRLRDGDETSCRNLYRPTRPRILGVPPEMVSRGGFRFANTLADDDATRDNPWQLLHRDLPDGAIPAIADEAAALWQLHRTLGDDIEITDDHGRPRRLRLVALTRGSILQGELIIAEQHFRELFPTLAGHAFFLIAAPVDAADSVEQALEHALAPYGLAVTPAADRLRELFAVQNTYLYTFQTLGGLGLLLGTVGLAVVLLRNIWERRRELALLRTLGFSTGALRTLVLTENAFLVGVGLLIGVAAAAVVTGPHIVQRGIQIPWLSLTTLFAGIFLAGLVAAALATRTILHTPLIPALRTE